MSTLTAQDTNRNSTAFGVLVIGCYFLHNIAVLASYDRSKHPTEDGYHQDEDGSPPPGLVSGSKGERFSRIANNNRDHLFQSALVFLVAKLYVAQGSDPLWNPAKVDNKDATVCLTAAMWTFFGARVIYTIAYLFGYNSPVPFRSLSWSLAFVSVLSACGITVWAMSKFYIAD